MKRYTLAMKRKLVSEYATGDFPRKEFLSKHQIPNSTFHQWIHAYAEELLPALDAGMTVSGFRRLKNDCNRKQRIIEFLSLVNCTANSHYRIKVAEIERIMRDQPKMFSIRLMCEALGIKHCTIVNRKKRHTPWFVLHKEQAVEHVKRVFNGSHQCYGAEKIAAVLKREGRKIGVDCVRQVMQEQKLVSIRGIYRHEYLKESRWFAAKTDEAVRFCPENREINSETEPPAQNPKV